MDALSALAHYDSDDEPQPAKATAAITATAATTTSEPAPPRKRKRTKARAETAASASTLVPRLPTPDFDGAAAAAAASHGDGKRVKSLRSDDAPFRPPAAPLHPLLAARAAAVSSAAHGGRVRSFAHVEGAWATHVFLPISFAPSRCSCGGDSDAKDGEGPPCIRSLAALEARANTAEASMRSGGDTAGAVAAAAATAGSADDSTPWHRFRLATLSMPATECMVTTPSASSSSSAAAVSSSSSFHISLSRTVVLRLHQIDEFVSAIKQQLRSLMRRAPLQIVLRDSKLYWNDDRTRRFCALMVWPSAATAPVATAAAAPTALLPESTSTITSADLASSSDRCTPLDWNAAADSHALMLQLISRIDDVLASFGQLPYYSPPELHATVSWKLPPTTPSSAAAATPPTAPAALLPLASSSSSTPCCVCICDRVQLSIGNRMYTLPFQA